MLSSFASNAILSKARAMYGKRLREENYRDLLNCKTVSEVAGYLKNRTSYSGILAGINENEVHRGQLEGKLRQKLFEDYASLCRYELSVGEHFADYLLEHGEIEQILHSLMYLDAGNPEDYLHVTLTDLEPVADPMQRLRQVYPNVMRLDFAALAPESEEGELTAEEAALRSPEELFHSFYEQMQGVKLSPEEAMLVRLTMDEIWGEPEGGQV